MAAADEYAPLVTGNIRFRLLSSSGEYALFSRTLRPEDNKRPEVGFRPKAFGILSYEWFTLKTDERNAGAYKFEDSEHHFLSLSSDGTLGRVEKSRDNQPEDICFKIANHKLGPSFQISTVGGATFKIGGQTRIHPFSEDSENFKDDKFLFDFRGVEITSDLQLKTNTLTDLTKKELNKLRYGFEASTYRQYKPRRMGHRTYKSQLKYNSGLAAMLLRGIPIYGDVRDIKKSEEQNEGDGSLVSFDGHKYSIHPTGTELKLEANQEFTVAYDHPDMPIEPSKKGGYVTTSVISGTLSTECEISVKIKGHPVPSLKFTWEVDVEEFDFEIKYDQ